jgi:hypothetical protein
MEAIQHYDPISGNFIRPHFNFNFCVWNYTAFLRKCIALIAKADNYYLEGATIEVAQADFPELPEINKLDILIN